MMLADRAYDADWIRALNNEQGAWANIPPKRNRKDPICFSPYLYRARNLVERFFNRIKHICLHACPYRSRLLRVADAWRADLLRSSAARPVRGVRPNWLQAVSLILMP